MPKSPFTIHHSLLMAFLCVLLAFTLTAAETFPCTFHLRSPDGAPLIGRILIYDHTGKILPATNPFALLNGTYCLELAASDYLVHVEIGARVNKVKQHFNVGKDRPNTLTFVLDGYTWEKSGGWNLCNPFFNNSPIQGAPPRYSSLAELIAQAQAAGLNMLGVTNLASLPAAPLTATYADNDDGERKLTVALAATKNCRLLFAWSNAKTNEKTSDQTVEKNFYVLEPRPYFAAEILARSARLAAVLAAARDRGALTVFASSMDKPLPETLFNLLAGNYAAIDISHGGEAYLFWQFLLELGCRLPAVAGGGNYPNVSMYVHTSTRYATAPDYLSALREGRSVITNGPFLRLYVIEENDAGEKIISGIGDALPAATRPRTVYVEAFASADDSDAIRRVELLYNGQVVETAAGKPDQKSMQITWNDLPLTQTGWLQARYVSTNGYLWALTNPLYLGTAREIFTHGLIANVELKINAPSAARNLTGNLTIENFGTVIFSRAVKAGERVKLTLPITAEISVVFPSAPPYRQTLYELSGARAYCEQMVAAAPRGLRRRENWFKLGELLTNIVAEISW